MGKLVFVVPVRHPKSVADWSVARGHLSQTLSSISAQVDGEWECRVIANFGTDLPEMPNGCRIKFVDLPLPNLPDRFLDTENFYDAVRHDKGLRVYEGIQDLEGDSYIMVVDFDDFVSKNIARFVNETKGESGWFLSDGYVYSGGKICFRTYRLNMICGTSLIIRRDLLGSFQKSDGTLDQGAIKRHLGSHLFIRGDFETTKHPLRPLPFIGAIYRIGNAQSTSKSKALFSEMTPLRSLRRNPIRFLKQLRGYKFISRQIRDEFNLR